MWRLKRSHDVLQCKRGLFSQELNDWLILRETQMSDEVESSARVVDQQQLTIPHIFQQIKLDHSDASYFSLVGFPLRKAIHSDFDEWGSLLCHPKLRKKAFFLHFSNKKQLI